MSGYRRPLLALALLSSCIFPVSSANSSETINYIYDVRGRLVKVSRSGTVNNGVTACYSHDKSANRTNVTVSTTDCSVTPPSFAINNVSVSEGGNLVFAVNKIGSASQSYSVNFTTADAVALSGFDYGATSGTLTFAPAEASKTITVATIQDAAVEGDETLVVNLSDATGGATISDNQGIGTIINDDETPPAFAINNVSVSEGGSLVFTVTKTGSVSQSYSVNFATADAGATAGSDYNAASGTLTFAPAETAKTITVVSIQDAAVEGDETLVINLSGATGGAAISDNQGIGTIINDDVAACSGIAFSVNDRSVIEGEPIVFTVTKSGSTASSCSINYATANGTATTPAYYAAASGTLTFTSAQSTRTVTITTVDNGRLNGNKTMYLNLSSPSAGATVSDSQGVGSIGPSGGGGDPCPLCRTSSQEGDPEGG